MQAYKLDPALFQALLQNHPEIKKHFEMEQRHRELAKFIKLHTVLGKLPADALKLLALESETVVVEAGELVLRPIAANPQAPPVWILTITDLRESKVPAPILMLCRILGILLEQLTIRRAVELRERVMRRLLRQKESFNARRTDAGSSRIDRVCAHERTA